MKNLIQCFLMSFCILCGIQASAQQVIDLSTGISNSNGTMLAVGATDDTWTVAMPGANISNPASFQPASCGLNNPSSYSGCDPSVRWLYPTGYSNAACPFGDYYFRTTFELACKPDSARFNFAHIGADDVISEIIVNGNIHTVSYGYAGWGVNTSLAVAAGELAAGPNEVLVHVYNWGYQPDYPTTPLGFELNGNLTVYASTTGAFSLSNSGNTVQATPAAAAGSHTWEVYSSSTGNQGSYTYAATYNTSTLSFQATAPCYLIQHTVKTACGTACSAQSICNLSCKGVCDISAPTNLKISYAGPIQPQSPTGPYKFSWNPVPGAASYVLEIIWNDPSCCRNNEQVSTLTVPLTTTNYTKEISSKCFSWNVKALCANGMSVAAGKKCETISGGSTPANKPAEGISRDNASLINIYPNPASATVSFEVASPRDMDFTITVTDINGRMVKTFDHLQTSGRHAQVKWDTAPLAKGIYIVNLITAGNEVIPQKLVIE